MRAQLRTPARERVGNHDGAAMIELTGTQHRRAASLLYPGGAELRTASPAEADRFPLCAGPVSSAKYTRRGLYICT